jgi:predicted DCC family thiol-disulfide oxidoreductase YuxK
MDKVTLFYDAKCAVCAAEIDYYRKVDVDKRLSYVDITSTNFDPSSVSIPEDRLNKYFNIQLEDGTFVEGVDSFIEIWKRIPKLNFAAKLAKYKPIHLALHLGYLVFSEVRPYLPKKDCPDGYCDVKFSKKL